MLKGTKLYSILNNKCPKCHQGDFFVSKNPYQMKIFDKMNPACSHCGEIFNKEVGFYYGAMYVSYGLNVALGVAMFILISVLLNFSLIAFLISYSLSVLVLFPVMMRLSRLIYINLFVKFDTEKAL